MSSAEEDAIRRDQYKRNTIAKSETRGGNEERTRIRRKKHRTIPLYDADKEPSCRFELKECSETTRINEERVKSMKMQELSDMLAEFNYMKNNEQTGKPACAFARMKSQLKEQEGQVEEEEEEEGEGGDESMKPKKVRKHDVTLASTLLNQREVEAQHTVQLHEDPFEKKAFEEAINLLPQPTYYNADDLSRKYTQEELQQLLRQGSLKIPLLTSEHETRIFAQSGRFILKKDKRVVVYPPCMRGKLCIGYTNYVDFEGLDSPIIFTAVMFPSEMDQQSSHIHINRPCVACSRYLIVKYVLTIRGIAARGGPDLLTPDTAYERKAVQILQIYRNIPDQIHGYNREYMLHPTVGEPIVSSICMLNRSRISFYRDNEQGGRMCANQDALLWKPDAIGDPRVGESIQSFPLGANPN